MITTMKHNICTLFENIKLIGTYYKADTKKLPKARIISLSEARTNKLYIF
jgi:hypothetical protein